MPGMPRMRQGSSREKMKELMIKLTKLQIMIDSKGGREISDRRECQVIVILQGK